MAPLVGGRPLALAAALILQSCAPGAIVGREVLADPLMRFDKTHPVCPTAWASEEPDLPLPPDTVSGSLRVFEEPGGDAKNTRVESLWRAGVELGSGFGVEAGYGVDRLDEQVLKIDGFAGPWHHSLVRHGPDGALLLDDGTSLLRLGYRLRMGPEGWQHQPSVRARTTVLGQDSIFEVGYRRSWEGVVIGEERLPAGRPINSSRTSDLLMAALEKGWLPGWAVRLDGELLIEEGFLQSPWRMVSLWSRRGLPDQSGAPLPLSLPESHPGVRSRWGLELRLRRALPGLGAALEFGGGAGSDSWRVEHQHVQAAWRQRLGAGLILEVRGGGYHQTRAFFYRNEYYGAPTGSWWSADRELAAYWAWWSEAFFGWTGFPSRGRWLGVFRYLSAGLHLRVQQALYHTEGLEAPAGFSGWEGLDGGARRAFAGGLSLGGWLELEGGF